MEIIVQMLSNLKATVARIHREEEGMETLQVVLIIAFAAIILAFAYKIFGGGSSNQTDTAGANNTVVGWVQSTMNNIFNWK